MPKKPTPLFDLALQRQVLLERVKSGQVKTYLEAIREAEKVVLAKVGRLQIDLADEGIRQANKWLAGLEKDFKRELTKGSNLLVKQLEHSAGVFAAFEAVDITQAMVKGVVLDAPTATQAWNLAKKQGMGHSGELLDDFIGNFAGGEAKRVTSAFRRGFQQGQTNYQIVRAIRGTKAMNYRDGILSVTKRNAEAVVRTSVQHAASVGRQATWEANKDIVEKYQWVSTLDSRTSNKCKSLDGQEFPVGEGPSPPIHVNCRSTTVAVPKPEFEFLAEGRTRSSVDGPVPAKQTYYDWLKNQPADFQNKALGKTRAELFRKGGLDAKKFADLNLDKNFNPLSLEEMKVLEPDAFKKAFGADAVPPILTPTPKAPVARAATVRKDVLGSATPESLKKLETLENSFGEIRQKWEQTGKLTNDESIEYFRRQKALNLHRAEMNVAAHEALSIPSSQRGDITTIAPFKRMTVNKAKVQAAAEFVSKVIAADRLPQVKKVNNRGSWRGSYTSAQRRININKKTTLGTTIHELVHDIEYNHPDIAAKTAAFRAKRAAGESTVKLKKLSPKSSYGWDEVTLEDKWAANGGSAYTGKVYAGRPATEVLTMGVQRLYEDPIRFARQDPEFFDFIIELIQN